MNWIVWLLILFENRANLQWLPDARNRKNNKQIQNICSKIAERGAESTVIFETRTTNDAFIDTCSHDLNGGYRVGQGAICEFFFLFGY